MLGVFTYTIPQTKIISGAPPRQCWKDYPYAFDGGKRCCKYETHTDSSPLSISGTTCKDNMDIKCTKEVCVKNGQ